jgi:hypothetical protein
MPTLLDKRRRPATSNVYACDRHRVTPDQCTRVAREPRRTGRAGATWPPFPLSAISASRGEIYAPAALVCMNWQWEAA